MLVIHIRDDPHPPGGIPLPGRDPNTGTLWTYHPYERESEPLRVVQDAVDLIRARVAQPGVTEACNSAFLAIRNVSFTDLFFGTAQVTIFRHPGRVAIGEYAATAGAAGLARHITLGRNCWRRASHEDSVLRSASTLIHELAHCAGAGGQSTVAESTLLYCGFPEQFMPDVVG